MLSRIEEGMGEMAVIYMCRYIYYVVLKYYRGRLALSARESLRQPGGSLLGRRHRTRGGSAVGTSSTEVGVKSKGKCAKTPYKYRLLNLKGDFIAHIRSNSNFRLGTVEISPKEPIVPYDYIARALCLLCQRCGFARWLIAYNYRG